MRRCALAVVSFVLGVVTPSLGLNKYGVILPHALTVGCCSCGCAGLFTIALVLSIQFANTFLTATDASSGKGVPLQLAGQRAAAAGGIMLGIFNAFAVICFGTLVLEEDKAEVYAERTM